MATTYTDPLGGTTLRPNVVGHQKQVSAVVADTAYATGGTVISPSALGLQNIDSITCGNTLLGKPCASVFASGVWKVLVFASIGTQVTDATDISATDPYHITVRGK